MHHKRNQRVNQVTENSLVVGIDIAKHTHYGLAIDDRGQELGKAFPFKQSLEGFHKLLMQLNQLKEDHQKTEVLVGFEPTGHYWKNLAAFLIEHEIPFVTVNPMHVNRTKELDDNLQTKNDQKDARVIAKLVTSGNFSFPRKLEGIEHELREGATLRNRIKDDIASTKNRITGFMDLYFPEFSHVFKGYGKQACAVLKNTPFPSDLKGQRPEELAAWIKECSKSTYSPKKKTERLCKLAEQSIGLTEGTVMARKQITTLVHQLELLQEQLYEVEQQLEELVKEMPEFEYLTSIRGIGEQTVVELLAYTGSLSGYDHPRQIIKLAGLTLRENSSGLMRGTKRLSKRGRKDLRSLLFKAILPLIQNNQSFYDLYQYYITRSENPLRKKEAMVVLCSKLIKVMHGLAKHETHFDPERMSEDIPFLQEVA
ncbi:IS110 family RNA-guided transposase [Alkalibacillus haloalkaliphilus]|uniref:IS110 family transposase n=1 Tax=Alkalibacillus haloalkaliphilus TaxID=94136 RepID=A0A511W7Y6_9BACI|nr:IS110 family transposase [Alkalibacillus haloalkaliphilus]GEN47205.1 IS110 family transposase [Alkalibacillus haloalkaliphilus]